MSDPIITALARIEQRLEQLATTPAPVAVKRAVAAKMMGIGVTKLDALVREGKVRHAEEDAHLIPVAEVKRYCAPKTKRQRRPSVGVRALRLKHNDAQSDEAIEEARRLVRAKARAR
jgi:hypothetical protein